MWRFAFLCSAVLTLTVACTDGPGAPSANTNEPSLAAGDPPPPPLDGGGRVTLFSGDELDATATVTQEGCVLPPSVIDIALDGEYFQNKSENNARIHFTPDPGSGTGIIHETANNTDPNASGTLVVMVVVGTIEQQLEIHVLDYVGLGTPPSSLFDFVLGDSFGSIFGNLDAEVMACGVKTAYTGVIRFNWGEGERL